MSIKLAVKKAIYNYDSAEKLEDAKIIGGNPNGIISYNQCPKRGRIRYIKIWKTVPGFQDKSI